MDRKKRIKIYGSPNFKKQIPLDPLDMFYYQPDETSEEAKYLPFDHIEIYNDSGSEILVRPNGTPTREYPVPAGVISQKDMEISFHSVQLIENSDNTVDKNSLKMVVKRRGMDADKKAQSEMEKSKIERFLSDTSILSLVGGL